LMVLTVPLSDLIKKDEIKEQSLIRRAVSCVSFIVLCKRNEVVIYAERDKIAALLKIYQ
jgi:hypothetical protein